MVPKQVVFISEPIEWYLYQSLSSGIYIRTYRVVFISEHIEWYLYLNSTVPLILPSSVQYLPVKMAEDTKDVRGSPQSSSRFDKIS